MQKKEVVKITHIGWKEFSAKAEKIPDEMIEEIDGFCLDAALNWVELAKESAVVDVGILKGNITPKRIGPLEYEVTSLAEYSPYVEWGTVERVDVPLELVEYAIQFKGAGIVKRGGVWPRPFFFIHKKAVGDELFGNIQNLLNEGF